MSKALDEAVEHLTTTYRSLAEAAAGYRNVLSAKEVNARLAKADPDTAEYIALQHLSVLMTAPVDDIDTAQTAQQDTTASE
jgi:hypothetical protein